MDPARTAALLPPLTGLILHVFNPPTAEAVGYFLSRRWRFTSGDLDSASTISRICQALPDGSERPSLPATFKSTRTT